MLEVTEIEVNELSSAIAPYISNNYKGTKVKEAAMITKGRLWGELHKSVLVAGFKREIFSRENMIYPT